MLARRGWRGGRERHIWWVVSWSHCGAAAHGHVHSPDVRSCITHMHVAHAGTPANSALPATNTASILPAHTTCSRPGCAEPGRSTGPPSSRAQRRGCCRCRHRLPLLGFLGHKQPYMLKPGSRSWRPVPPRQHGRPGAIARMRRACHPHICPKTQSRPCGWEECTRCYVRQKRKPGTSCRSCGS